MRMNLQFFGGRGAGSGTSANSGRGSAGISPRVQNEIDALSTQEQAVANTVAKRMGGIWAVAENTRGNTILMSDKTYNQQEAAQAVTQIKNDLKQAGLSKNVTDVSYYWSGSRDDGRELRISVTAKKPR